MASRLTLLYAILFVINANAQDCLPGWRYFRTLQLDNSQNSEALNDFQARVPVNTAELFAEGKLQADGADLRFVDEDCNELPYFLDSLAGSAENVAWVRIPFIAAGGTLSIRMYYGNEMADPAADGDAVFLFFDDFEDGGIDPLKWETVGEYHKLKVNDGVLAYASTGTASGARFKFVRTAPSFSEPVCIEARLSAGTSSTFGLSSDSGEELERIYFRYNSGAFSNDTMNILARLQDTMTNGFAFGTDYPLIIFPKRELVNMRLKASVNQDGNIAITEIANLDNGSANLSERVVEQYSMQAFHFCLSTFSTGEDALLDYVRIRKPVDMQPLASFGEETNNPLTSLREAEVAPAFRIFPNPATSYCELRYEGPRPAARLRVFNAAGQPVAEFLRPSWPQVLSLHGYAPGYYWLEVEDTTGQAYRQRLMVAGR